MSGRSGKAYADWLKERGDAFPAGVEVATLDPFHGYKNAIDDQLEQATRGHRGRKGDPLYGIRMLLRASAEKLTDRQKRRLAAAIGANEAHLEVWLAWACAQRLRAAYRHPNPVEGRRIAERVVETFPTCPVTEIARPGRTLRQWKSAFLAYFDTGRASNGGTEAIDGLIELHRRIARGFTNRDNYRLRILLTGGGLRDPHLK